MQIIKAELYNDFNMKKNLVTILLKRSYLLLMLLSVNLAVFAQEKVEMADIMRSNGKIYTVVAVCLTILIGLFLYMFMVDRRLRKVEKENTH